MFMFIQLNIVIFMNASYDIHKQSCSNSMLVVATRMFMHIVTSIHKDNYVKLYKHKHDMIQLCTINLFLLLFWFLQHKYLSSPFGFQLFQSSQHYINDDKYPWAYSNIVIIPFIPRHYCYYLWWVGGNITLIVIMMITITLCWLFDLTEQYLDYENH